jgi:hypothetical protein
MFYKLSKHGKLKVAMTHEDDDYSVDTSNQHQPSKCPKRDYQKYPIIIFLDHKII